MFWGLNLAPKFLEVKLKCFLTRTIISLIFPSYFVYKALTRYRNYIQRVTLLQLHYIVI